MKRVVIALAALVLSGSSASAQSMKVYTELSPPNQFNGPDGKLTGIAVDLVQEIQKRIGNKDPIEVVPWARGYQEVQNDPNVILFTMARTKDRNPLFRWVGPVVESTYCFYAKADSKLVVKSLDDAKKLGSIGVYRNDVRDLFLTKAGFTNLDRSTDNETNVKKVMAGRLDVFASARNGVSELAKAAGFKAEDFKEIFPFFKVQLYITLSKATPESTITAWTNAFESLKKDGTFERIYKKYLPSEPLPGPAITNFD
jgi:polar amino acid transport system substrate-binding protein